MILRKTIDLYETKNSRHSTMIVGKSNTAKSATWTVLKNTMTSLTKDGKPGFNVVYEFPINPKALNLGELYGEYNLATGEWHDGVISSIMRKTCSGKYMYCNYNNKKKLGFRRLNFVIYEVTYTLLKYQNLSLTLFPKYQTVILMSFWCAKI